MSEIENSLLIIRKLQFCLTPKTDYLNKRHIYLLKNCCFKCLYTFFNVYNNQLQFFKH